MGNDVLVRRVGDGDLFISRAGHADPCLNQEPGQCQAPGLSVNRPFRRIQSDTRCPYPLKVNTVQPSTSCAPTPVRNAIVRRAMGKPNRLTAK